MNVLEHAWPPVLALEDLVSTMSAGVSSGWEGASPHDQFVAEMEGYIFLLHWALWGSSYLWNGRCFLVYLPGDSPYDCGENTFFRLFLKG